MKFKLLQILISISYRLWNKGICVRNVDSVEIITNGKIGKVRCFFGLLFMIISALLLLIILCGIFSFFYTKTVDNQWYVPFLVFGVSFVVFAIVSVILLKPLFSILKKRNEMKIHENGQKYAGFWRRLGAGCVDSIIIAPVCFVGYFVGPISFVEFEIFYWIGILGTVYTIAMTTIYGQTLGKMLFSIRIFQLDGLNVSFSHSLKRSLGDVIVWVLLLVVHIAEIQQTNLVQLNGKTFHEIGLILHRSHISLFADFVIFSLILWYLSEFISLLFSKKNRAIHDFIAGTVVLNQKKV